MTAEDGARQLLIVGHVPSDNTQGLRDAAAGGASEGDSVRVVILSPFETRPTRKRRTCQRALPLARLSSTLQ